MSWEIGIIDSMPIIRLGVTKFLEGHSFSVKCSYESCWSILQNNSDNFPTILIIDSFHEFGNSPIIIKKLLQLSKNLRVINYSSYTERVELEAIHKAGVLSSVAKTDPLECLLTACNKATSNEKYLSTSISNRFPTGLAVTPRAIKNPYLFSEQEILVIQMFFSGLSIKKLAPALGISINTAYHYLDRAKKKCGVSSIVQLLKISSKLGIIRI